MDSDRNDESSMGPHVQFDNSPMYVVSDFVWRPDLYFPIRKYLDRAMDEEDRYQKIMLIHGVSGAGKTQIVLHYIEKHKRCYAAIFWVTVGPPGGFERDLKSIHAEIFKNTRIGRNQFLPVPGLLANIKGWFKGKASRYLWVVDNFDHVKDPKDPASIDIANIIPRDRSVDVLITSRSPDIAQLTPVKSMLIDGMREDEALQLFSKCSQTKFGFHHQSTINLAKQILAELCYLPLAIRMAGTAVLDLGKAPLNLESYLNAYRQTCAEVLDQKPPQESRYGLSLLASWETSFNMVRCKSRSAADLICYLSLLDGKCFSLDWIRQATNRFDRYVEKEMETGSSRYDTMIKMDPPVESHFSLLESFSFIEFNRKQKCYSMHPFAQALGFERESFDFRIKLGLLVSRVLENHTKSQPESVLANNAQVFGHIEACLGAMSRVLIREKPSDYDETTIFRELDRSWIKLAEFVRSHGFYTLDRDTHLFLLERNNSLFGEKHVRTIVAMILASKMHAAQCSFTKSLNMSRAAMDIARKKFGEDHLVRINAEQTHGIALNQCGYVLQAATLLQENYNSVQRQLVEKRKQAKNSLRLMSTAFNDLGMDDSLIEASNKFLQSAYRYQDQNADLVAEAQLHLAELLARQGKREDAAKLVKDLIAQARWSRSVVKFERLFDIFYAGLFEKVSPFEQIRLCQLAAIRARRDGGKDSESAVRKQLILAKLLLGCKRYAEAIELLEDLKIRTSHGELSRDGFDDEANTLLDSARRDKLEWKRSLEVFANKISLILKGKEDPQRLRDWMFWIELARTKTADLPPCAVLLDWSSRANRVFAEWQPMNRLIAGWLEKAFERAKEIEMTDAKWWLKTIDNWGDADLNWLEDPLLQLMDYAASRYIVPPTIVPTANTPVLSWTPSISTMSTTTFPPSG